MLDQAPTKSIAVEVNLRIPRMKVPSLDEKGYPIDNSMIRFTKMITVPAIPKPGAMLQLTDIAGRMLTVEVKSTTMGMNQDTGVQFPKCL